MAKKKQKKACCTPAASPYASPPLPEVGPQVARIKTGATADMVLLDGGPFTMGDESDVGFAEDGEGPKRQVRLDPFYVDRYPVTNRQYQAFVKATHYRTEAESFGWSFVFHLLLPPYLLQKLVADNRVVGLQWWIKVDGACWSRPEGPQSNIKKRLDHPVVHISWRDAAAYCQWAGKRLPTEAEWEYAARGGLVSKRYAWGDELTPGNLHRCNIWQGDFPTANSAEDGYVGTSPVFVYQANGYGLHDVAGNVWEWCNDWFSPDYHQRGEPSENPTGPPRSDNKLMKGGSYLCHDSYCNRYRVAARTKNTPDSSTGNLGFRCVRDV